MYAIATLVMNGNRYVPGAVALANSARLFSLARLVCMITDDVTDREPLNRAFDEVLVVERITVQPPRLASAQSERIYGGWIADAPTKWNVLSLEKYDKVLFMDSDMIIIAPFDSVFTLSTPAAPFYHQMSSTMIKHEGYSGGKGAERGGFADPYVNVKHGDTVPVAVINDIRTGKTPYAFQGGVALLTPSRMALNLYKRSVQEIIRSLPAKSLAAVDELTLTMFYADNGYTWTHIDPRYDLAAYHLYGSYQLETERVIAANRGLPPTQQKPVPIVYALHYIFEYKPWMENRETALANIASLSPAAQARFMELYDLWWRMYRRDYLPTGSAVITGQRQDLRTRLTDILLPILGERTSVVLDRMWTMYAQCFVHKSANPAVNYELLEAYGDQFLAGFYTWILIDTPGIITPDQVTKISDFFQNRFALERICDALSLTDYIVSKDPIDTKMKSDIVEALIAAIGVSWQRVANRGNWAMNKFIRTIYDTYFTIEPERYQILYGNPADRMKALVEQSYLNRSLLRVAPPQEVNGEIVISVYYDQFLLGTGKATLTGVYRDTAIENARRAAYIDALDRNTLSTYLASRR